MKNAFLLLTPIFSTSAIASDLTSKVECVLTHEQTTYVDNKAVVKSQAVPLIKGQNNTYPPSFYIGARYVVTGPTEENAIFGFHMQENDNVIAVSFSKMRGEESTDLASLRLNPKESLDIKIPVAPRQGPIWNPVIRELHLVCKGRS